jgi:cystathionine beta-synthase
LKYAQNVLGLIGNTPLVKLNRVSAGLKPVILAKLEFMNPGGSVKDRIGVAMLEDAEQRQLISKGGTVIEPSSGNTGVGLAIACILKGYSLVVTMPDKMSSEKRQLLQAYGARVIVCPTDVPPGHPDHYLTVANKLHQDTPNSFVPNQYYNMANPCAHYSTTGREIWEQTEGRINCLVVGMGTGGTISGVARYLKEKNRKVKIVGVDPEGSILKPVFEGEKEPKAHVYKIEGIGEDFVPKTTDLSLVDRIVSVTDKEAYLMARRLAREEALLTGSSSGAAVAGALKVAADLCSDDVLVTILADRGERYLTKVFNDEWMKTQGFI